MATSCSTTRAKTTRVKFKRTEGKLFSEATTLTSFFCACENASVSGACPCVGVYDLCLCPDRTRPPWAGTSGGVWNAERMSSRHP